MLNSGLVEWRSNLRLLLWTGPQQHAKNPALFWEEKKGIKYWESNTFSANFRHVCWHEGLVSSSQIWCTATESDLQTIAVPNSTSCAGSEGKNTGSLISERFELSYTNKVMLAVELFTGWLDEALVTDLNELILWLSFTVFPSSPLQLLHVITGKLSVSHLQKDIMKSNSKDIHFFLLDYLPWLLRWGVDGLFPTAPRSGHPHAQCRQGLSALQ